MTRILSAWKRHLPALALVAMALLLVPSDAASQTIPALLVFRPHCEELDQTKCKAYDIADPSTLVTPLMKAGDTLDVDIVLINSRQDAIEKVRLWLSYDADALEGASLTISPLFPTVMPGQSDFVPLSGYAKIGASAAAGKEPRDPLIAIARLTFTVKAGTVASTPLSFYDQRTGIEGHTFITTVAAPTQNLLSTPLGSLIVQMTPAAPAAQSSSSLVYAAETSSSAIASSAAVSPAANGTASSTASVPQASSFSLIQAQNVRVSTEGTALYVTWDPLSHPKLQGYNVYYGTMPARYLQRRSVSIASRGAVIRDLPAGKTYYVAVKGVDDQNKETSFSTEASVEIGNPSTSSAPIAGSLDVISEVAPENSAPSNPVESLYDAVGGTTVQDVPGKSGAPSGIVLLLLGSAMLGTLLACRRQMIASRRYPL